MKKLLLCSIIAAMLVSFAGCGATDSSQDPEKSATTVATTTTPTATTTSDSENVTSVQTTTSTESTTTTVTTTVPVQDMEETKVEVETVKSKYYSSATAFACVEIIADYFGYETNQDDMIKYLNTVSTENAFYTYGGVEYLTAQLTNTFIGDPADKDAIGSGFDAISFAVENYFQENNIPLSVSTFGNSADFADLKNYIDEERFFIRWIAEDINKYTVYCEETDYGSEPIQWPDNMSCMLLVGAGDYTATFYDPITDEEITMTEEEYNKRAFDYNFLVIDKG